MSVVDDIIGMSAYTGDKYWYFVDDKIRRRGRLGFAQQDTPSFTINVTEDEAIKIRNSPDW